MSNVLGDEMPPKRKKRKREKKSDDIFCDNMLFSTSYQGARMIVRISSK